MRFFTPFRFRFLVLFFFLFTLVEVCFASSNLKIIPPKQISGIDLVNHKSIDFKLNDSKLGTVVIFLSARCPCSDSHIQCEVKGDDQGNGIEFRTKKLRLIDEIVREFGPAGFKFVGVHSNADESFEESIKYFDKKLPFSVIQDDKSLIAKQFAAYKTPHAYIISPGLKVLFMGGITNSHHPINASKNYLKEALQAIQRGEKPSEAEVRVMGCRIHRPEDLN